jgi:hypothetical protein
VRPRALTCIGARVRYSRGCLEYLALPVPPSTHTLPLNKSSTDTGHHYKHYPSFPEDVEEFERNNVHSYISFFTLLIFSPLVVLIRPRALIFFSRRLQLFFSLPFDVVCSRRPDARTIEMFDSCCGGSARSLPRACALNALRLLLGCCSHSSFDANGTI